MWYNAVFSSYWPERDQRKGQKVSEWDIYSSLFDLDNTASH